MKALRLKPGKERSLYKRHPWVFASSFDEEARGQSGETVRLEEADGAFLAYAAWSPASQIRARVWSFDEAAIIDHRFFKNAVRAAQARRQAIAFDADAYRVIHGESDGLPGLIVDRYGDVAVAQFTSAGTERFKDAIVQALVTELGVAAIYERSDSSVRKLEGLEPARGWLHGERGLVQPFKENGIAFEVNVELGHKTGFYLDQRNSRGRFARAVREAKAEHVLNCYAYTGGFSLAALSGGATHVLSIDSSAPALAQLQAHVQLNAFDAARSEVRDADVNESLRELRAEGRSFDAIVLDPPKFAPSAAHAQRAARAYKDINRLGLHLLKPGGVLFTFSCSGGIGQEFFEQIIASAAQEARCDAAIVERLGAGHDHPHTLAFPEGEYLKGLFLRKLP